MKYTAYSLMVCSCLCLLTACDTELKQQLAKCEVETLKLYPANTADKFYSYDGIEKINYRYNCMMAAGYENKNSKACQEDAHASSNPDCYISMNIWGKLTQ